MKKGSFPVFWACLIIVFLAIAPSFALGEGNRNLILIGIMAAAPVIYLCNIGRMYRDDIILAIFIGMLLILPNMSNPQYMRWSTVLYSVMFCINFIVFSHFVRSGYFTPTLYEKLLRVLICSYGIVLLIQQFCVLTGLPILNLSNYDPKTPWKLNSLSSEPSHSARIIVILMYSWICARETISGNRYEVVKQFIKDKWIWMSFLYTMIMMGSGTSFVMLPILALKLLSFRNLIKSSLVVLLFVIGVAVIDNPAVERAKRFTMAAVTLDVDAINQADGSAAYRIVPQIICAKKAEIFSFDGLFGKGIDYTATFLQDYLLAAHEGTTGGGMFQVWIEYGFLIALVFTIFSARVCIRRGDLASLFLWFFMVFLYGINNQIIWLTISLLYANKYFSQRVSRQQIKKHFRDIRPINTLGSGKKDESISIS